MKFSVEREGVFFEAGEDGGGREDVRLEGVEGGAEVKGLLEAVSGALRYI